MCNEKSTCHLRSLSCGMDAILSRSAQYNIIIHLNIVNMVIPSFCHCDTRRSSMLKGATSLPAWLCIPVYARIPYFFHFNNAAFMRSSAPVSGSVCSYHLEFQEFSLSARQSSSANGPGIVSRHLQSRLYIFIYLIQFCYKLVGTSRRRK